jgi:hypothetical protein
MRKETIMVELGRRHLTICLQKLMETTEDFSLCSQPSCRHPEPLILYMGGLPTSAQNRVLCEMKIKRVCQYCEFVSSFCKKKKKLLLGKIFLKICQNKMLVNLIPISKFAWPLYC